MNEYIILATEAVITSQAMRVIVRDIGKGSSLPADLGSDESAITDATLAPYGLGKIWPDTKPIYNSKCQTIVTGEIEYRVDKWCRPYTVVDKPDATIIAAIKIEAGRRILVILPEWKQRNLIARGTELNTIHAQNGVWTQTEANEVAALETIWNSVKAIRTKSDEIEATVATADFSTFDPTDDALWI